MEQRKKHLIFVDWMKVIGMYAIILGHFTPPHFEIPDLFI